MRNLMKALLASLAIALIVAAPVRAVTIDFVPAGPYAVTAGGTLSVDVVVSGLGGDIVSAYDLDVVYDPTVLTIGVPGVTFSVKLGDSSLFEALESVNSPAGGVLDFASVSLLSDADLLSLQGGSSVTLATLLFGVLQDATTALAFSWTTANDIKGAGNTVIFPTPEPGTLLLIAAGLAGAAMRRRVRA